MIDYFNYKYVKHYYNIPSLSLIIINYNSHFILVQLRGETFGSKGKLYEASSGRNNDEDGGSRKRFHEGQAKGKPKIFYYTLVLL